MQTQAASVDRLTESGSSFAALVFRPDCANQASRGVRPNQSVCSLNENSCIRKDHTHSG